MRIGISKYEHEHAHIHGMPFSECCVLLPVVSWCVACVVCVVCAVRVVCGVCVL